MSDLRALTVRQPWAFAIAHGTKRVENCGRPIRYRGLLAIHAGAYSRWDRDGETSRLVREAWRRWSTTLPPPNVTGPLRRQSLHLDFGAVIAIAEVTGCHSSADSECSDKQGQMCSPWAAWAPFEDPPAYHWLLDNVQPLARPVPCRGALGLWRLPDDVAAQVRAQLEATADV